MARELIYTSAPRGLRPGTSGFCTVAHTVGLSAASVARLEALSAAPVARLVHACRRVTLDGVPHLVLSRAATIGPDYTRRNNKLVHHLVLDVDERPAAGPAEVLSSGLLRSQYDAPPGLIVEPLRIDLIDLATVAGDGDFASSVDRLVAAIDPLTSADTALYVVTSGNPMALLRSAFALLDNDARWGVTFDTAWTSAMPGVTCRVRFVPARAVPAGAAALRLE